MVGSAERDFQTVLSAFSPLGWRMLMDVTEQLRELSTKASNQLKHIRTEEATKNAFVMPFIQALGYNVFDPTEVVPEFTADVGTKRGEKVDYAILRDGKPIILFEVKSATTDLHEDHLSQLLRYFAVSDAKFGILTNGLEYRFHTDLEKTNRMDEKPFMVVDILNLDARMFSEITKFAQSSFNVEKILSSANELKYRREISFLLEREYIQPSADFVRHFAKQVHSRKLTQKVMDEFTEIVKKAYREFINDKIADRLQSAIESENDDYGPDLPDVADLRESVSDRSDVVTTQDETDGYYVVKSILRETIDPSRVFMRDVKSYCSVLIDDNNRKTICRLRFNKPSKLLGLFDSKKEKRVRVDTVDDIYKYSEQLKAAAYRHLKS